VRTCGEEERCVPEGKRRGVYLRGRVEVCTCGEEERCVPEGKRRGAYLRGRGAVRT